MYSDQRTKTTYHSVQTLCKTDTIFTTGAQKLVTVTDGPWRLENTVQMSNTFTGYYDNPGWRSRVKNGFQAGSPANGSYETYVTSPAKIKWTIPNKTTAGYNGYQEKVWWATGAVPHTVAGGSVASASEANNLALKRVYRKLDALVGEMKLLVSAGEAAETIRMLRSPTRSLFEGVSRYVDDAKRHVKSLRRRQPIKRRSAITRANTVLGGLWLEHRLGWTPLINDIEGAFGSLTKIAQRPHEKEHFVVSGQGESVSATPSYATITWVGLGADANARWRRERRISVRYIVGVTLDPNISKLGAVRDGFGLHWSEFVPTVWELIPYSFVADYFTNIGDVVSAFSTRQRNISWIVKTTQTGQLNTLEELVPLIWSSSSGYENTKAVQGRPKGVYSKGSFTRELPSSLDIPSLEVNGFDKVNPVQGLNMLALFTTSRMVERMIARSLK